VTLAWQCYQQLRSIYHAGIDQGRQIAEKVIGSFPSCPIPEVAHLGRTLKTWKAQVLAYLDTAGVSNGGTEAIIIWSRRKRGVDVADAPVGLCGSHVLWSLSLTSPMSQQVSGRPWRDSKLCRSGLRRRREWL
jgi:hypothetical protein